MWWLGYRGNNGARGGGNVDGGDCGCGYDCGSGNNDGGKGVDSVMLVFVVVGCNGHFIL